MNDATPLDRTRIQPLSVLGFGDGCDNTAAEGQWKTLLRHWARPTVSELRGEDGERQLRASLNDLVFFQLDVAVGTISQRSIPDCVLRRHRYLIQAMNTTSHDRRVEPKVASEASLAAASVAEENSQTPLLRLYGTTDDGLSILANVHGFYPYCYCECPSPLATELRRNGKDVEGGNWRVNAVTEQLRAILEENLKSHSQGKNYHKRVVDVRLEEKESLMFYSPSKRSQLFFRITVASPQMISAVRTQIEQGINLSVCGRNSPNERTSSGVSTTLRVAPISYESNIPFVLRYLVDTGTVGCSWIVAKKGFYSVRHPNVKESTCEVEIDVHYADLQSLLPVDKWQRLPTLRMLSFDIECVKLDGQGFPDAHDDPVIQISSIIVDQQHGSEGSDKSDADNPISNIIFTLHECAPIAGATVVWFDDEAEMLQKWAAFVREVDPDFLTGYNCINFDLFYLVTRANVLKAESFCRLSRLKSIESRIKDTSFSSRALGTHESKEITVEGRIQFDVLELVRREYKLKSYTLNYVSFEFLKEQKEDVHYSMIGDLFRGSPSSRRRIAVYCLKDAYLPLRLLNKLLFLYNYVEMSRVTGTPLTYLLTRGQQIKVTAQLLRKCRQLEYVVPAVKRVSGDTDKYEGATVLDPVKGFYECPIATLDFASLYPSIMMAHNLCYSTLVRGDDLNRLSSGEVTHTSSNPRHTFVKSCLRKGVLPMIVEELIAARKAARRAMAETSDAFTKRVLNGRQLALKITANSVYGYTGATAGGQLPCLEVATSITCFGRDMIEYTKRRVEEIYTKENGYKFDAFVIYGDTDSVMVRFGHLPIEEAMRLGEDAARKISQEFVAPIRLEFEKVYCPFLLMNKKRYAGLLYTSPNKYDKIDFKGIETVRRDFSLLVQHMVDTVLKKMLIEKDVEAAKMFVRTKIADLLQNKIDLSLLVVTKSLGKMDYETKLPHVELARKLRKRDPGTAPNVGDRVSYVVVQGLKGQAQYEKAEDPLYVLEHNLPIDTKHYLDTLKAPLIRIFEGVMSNPESLFSGGHTLKKTVMLSSQGAMSKFVTRGLQCIGCRTTINDGALCKHCQHKEGQIAQRKFVEMREKEKEHSDLWTECQRCQGSLHQDVICVNRDCPIFYRRAKVKKEISATEESIRRLQISSNW